VSFVCFVFTSSHPSVLPPIHTDPQKGPLTTTSQSHIDGGSRQQCGTLARAPSAGRRRGRPPLPRARTRHGRRGPVAWEPYVESTLVGRGDGAAMKALSGAPRGAYSVHRSKTRQQLVPPKPKELDMTRFTWPSWRLVSMLRSLPSSTTSSRLADSARKSLFTIMSE